MERHLVVTDFDGTLASLGGEVSSRNRKTLESLGDKGHVRVIATGRNLFSVRKVINPDFPVDYVVFTTGAGLIHWPTQKILVSHHLEKSDIDKIYKCFISRALDFMVHQPIPDNHHFEFFETGLENPDFETRKLHYGPYCKAGVSEKLPDKATQFLAVLRSNQSEDLLLKVFNELGDVNIVRATSPFDHRSIWMEVFSRNAAKHLTAQHLSRELNISHKNTIAVGNDYNDIELLNWASKAFAVGNAIRELKDRHEVVAPAEDSGFAEAMQRVLGD